MRERGLKLERWEHDGYTWEVAPRAGAWIETVFGGWIRRCFGVAPRAGAWIETRCDEVYIEDIRGRSPCGSVD